MNLAWDAPIALAVVVGVPLFIAGWVFLSERVIARAGRKTRGRIRPWLWLLPGLVLMGTILIYPFIASLRFSFGDSEGEGWVGLANYEWAFTTPAIQTAIINSILWMFIMPIIVLIIGLVFAVLADRVRYERVAKTIVMIPSALSLVVGGVIWTLVYRYDPPGRESTGLANALYTGITGNDPIAWTLDRSINTPALMMIGLWMWLGFAMLLLSAGVKGVPIEYLEAARIDGASEWKIFWNITFRQLIPTLLVTLTMLTVWALKVFDIVWVMTLGRYGTEVLATRVYYELFTSIELGQGSALAILMFIIVLPVMGINIWRIRHEEKA